MLLPEEVIYLVERGSLDVQYRVSGQEQSPEDGKPVEDDEIKADSKSRDESEGWNGISMSLQACYANFIGCDGLTLERYTVYAALKRSGYIVTRAPGWHGVPQYPRTTLYNPQPRPVDKREGQTIWQWLYTLLFAQQYREPPPLGPLMAPGLYRKYSITSHLSLLRVPVT